MWSVTIAFLTSCDTCTECLWSVRKKELCFCVVGLPGIEPGSLSRLSTIYQEKWVLHSNYGKNNLRLPTNWNTVCDLLLCKLKSVLLTCLFANEATRTLEKLVNEYWDKCIIKSITFSPLYNLHHMPWARHDLFFQWAYIYTALKIRWS